MFSYGWERKLEALSTWLAANLVVLVALLGALGTAFRWMHQQSKERAERREKRYWELVDVAIGRDDLKSPPFVMRQIAALHLLAGYKEFNAVTKALFKDALERSDPWAVNHRTTLTSLLKNISD